MFFLDSALWYHLSCDLEIFGGIFGVFVFKIKVCCLIESKAYFNLLLVWMILFEHMKRAPRFKKGHFADLCHHAKKLQNHGERLSEIGKHVPLVALLILILDCMLFCLTMVLIFKQQSPHRKNGGKQKKNIFKTKKKNLQTLKVKRQKRRLLLRLEQDTFLGFRFPNPRRNLRLGEKKNSKLRWRS